MIKRIIFDLDNTLIEWIDEYDDALKDTLIKYNIDFDYRVLTNTIDEYDYNSEIYNSYDLIDYINTKHNLNITIDFINDWLCELGTKGDVSKEVVELLEYLSSKYELVVLTNWEGACQRNRLKAAGIYKYFKEVYGGEVFKKPNLEAFKNAIGPYNIDECIMIGDSMKFDIEPAKKLGIKTYMVGQDIDILDLKEML
nr:HAD family hydrolase [Bacilli bacterium]